jgi:hypothetical protein
MTTQCCGLQQYIRRGSSANMNPPFFLLPYRMFEFLSTAVASYDCNFLAMVYLSHQFFKMLHETFFCLASFCHKLSAILVCIRRVEKLLVSYIRI